MRRVTAVVLLGLVAVLAAAPAPAVAHPAGVQAAVDYRTRVTGVSPALPGLHVRFVADGSRLELRNDTGRTVEILGYQGEPMLQVRPDGTWRNTRSPSAYLNQPGEPPKPGTDAAAAPVWERISRSTLARWPDHRTVWHGDPPPLVAADPGRPHRIQNWTVPLRDGTAAVVITGTLDWVPPPNASTWWSVTLLLAAAIAALGLVTSRPAAVRAALAGVALCAGAAAIVYSLLVVVDNVEPGAGKLTAALLSQALPVLSGLALIAAGWAVLARRTIADLALAFTGACVAFFAGTSNAAVFAHGVAPVTAGGVWARLAEVAVLAGGIGLAGAAVLRIRRAARPAEQPAPVPVPE
jgi:hypothetical protein